MKISRGCCEHKGRKKFLGVVPDNVIASLSLRMLTFIDASDYVEAAPGLASLKFTDEKQQAKFELGVCMAVYKWEELTTAVENSWGGPKSAEKRDWISGIVVDLFDEKAVDAELIEETLLYAMVDEFDAEIQNELALQIASLVLKFYRQVEQHQYDSITSLYDQWLLKQQAKATASEKIQFPPDPNNPDLVFSSDEDDDNDDDESVPNLQGDDDMQVDTELETGPIIDEDGFQMVQPRNRRGGRR